MPDKPRDNEFLKQNQAAQFMQRTTETMTRKLGGIFNNTAKSFSINTDFQLENTNTLKRIDSSLTNLNKTLASQGNLLSKNNTAALRLQQQTAKFLKDSKTIKAEKASLSTKDFIRRQDPNESMRTNIEDMEKLLTEIRDNEADAKKKKKGGLLGLLGGFGGLLVGGGLLGYLMTGKKEFLIHIVKGMTKYIGKSLVGLFKIGKMATSIKNITKIGSVFKAIGAVTKTLGKVFGKGFGKSVTKAGTKSLAKGVGKAGSKSLLKKIPVVGGLLGLMYGIMRFRKGDWIGGLLEVASGIASIVPGVGTALSIGIDALLLFRDFKGVETGAGSANEKFVGGTKKFGMSFLRNLPGIGTVLRMKEGFKQWSGGSKRKALGTFAGALSSIIPGGGVLFDVTNTMVDVFAEKGLIGRVTKIADEGIFKKGVSILGDSVTGVAGLAGKGIGNLFGRKKREDRGGDNIHAYTARGIKSFGTASKYKISEFIESKMLDIGFHPSVKSKRDLKGIKSKQKYKGITYYDPWNPNFEGVQPDMKMNFKNMAQEYFAKTGNTIQVNSGKRYGGGNSTHNTGWAIDINSQDANVLENMGLLQRYGFHRPLLNWSKKKEPWHVEPYPGEDVYGDRNTINNDFRIKTLMNKNPKFTMPQQGGDNINVPKSIIPQQGGDNINAPQGIVENKLKSDKPIQVVLTDKDINNLAIAIGEQIKKIKPKSQPLSNTQIVSGRKL